MATRAKESLTHGTSACITVYILGPPTRSDGGRSADGGAPPRFGVKSKHHRFLVLRRDLMAAVRVTIELSGVWVVVRDLLQETLEVQSNNHRFLTP
ncbi:hypothetical protein BHE74_00033689 [Ensete ventricosum]|nr:hypothetical protein BHE74_00033689 [Ensete ventricosum]